MTEKSFKFARDNHLPFYFVSASDGTNVVKVCEKFLYRQTEILFDGISKIFVGYSRI